MIDRKKCEKKEPSLISLKSNLLAKINKQKLQVNGNKTYFYRSHTIATIGEKVIVSYKKSQF